jgi:hypothetical protein
MNKHLRDSIKTGAVALAGAGSTITLAGYNEWVAAGIASLTLVYLIFKCVDWVADKAFEKRQQPTKRKRKYEED